MKYKHVIIPLCFRPLCASGMDKLELQDCLEHGRVAKVRYSQNTEWSQRWGDVFSLVKRLPGCAGLTVFLLFHSLGRCAPSLPAPTPSNKGRINTSPSWWTGRRTYCGALSWRGEQETHKHTHRFTSKSSQRRYDTDCNVGCVFLNPAGSSASPSTTQTCPTWVAAPGRNSWAGPGASPSSGTCLHRWKTTSPVNRRRTIARKTDATYKYTPAFQLWCWLVCKEQDALPTLRATSAGE